MFDGHVEVVTSYANGALDTIGADSLPNLTVNAHSFPDPLAQQGVEGFVDNGHLGETTAASSGAPAAAPAPATGARTSRGTRSTAQPQLAAIPGVVAPAASSGTGPTGSSTAGASAPGGAATGTDAPGTPAQSTSGGATAQAKANIPGAAVAAGLAVAAPHPSGTGTATPATRSRTSAPYRQHSAPATATPGTKSQQAFINQIAPGALAAQQRFGVPASVTIAQAIDESGWGTSQLAASDYNLFGIKGSGPAGSVTFPTQEFENGQWVTIDAQFRVYHNVSESISDHAELLATSGYYTRAMADRAVPDAFANDLTGVYATDPEYGANLIALMRLYNLYRFDSATVSQAQAAAPSHTPAAHSPAGHPSGSPGSEAQPSIPGILSALSPALAGTPTPNATHTPTTQPSATHPRGSSAFRAAGLNPGHPVGPCTGAGRHADAERHPDTDRAAVRVAAVRSADRRPAVGHPSIDSPAIRVRAVRGAGLDPRHPVGPRTAAGRHADAERHPATGRAAVRLEPSASRPSCSHQPPSPRRPSRRAPAGRDRAVRNPAVRNPAVGGSAAGVAAVGRSGVGTPAVGAQASGGQASVPGMMSALSPALAGTPTPSATQPPTDTASPAATPVTSGAVAAPGGAAMPANGAAATAGSAPQGSAAPHASSAAPHGNVAASVQGAAAVPGIGAPTSTSSATHSNSTAAHGNYAAASQGTAAVPGTGLSGPPSSPPQGNTGADESTAAYGNRAATAQAQPRFRATAPLPQRHRPQANTRYGGTAAYASSPPTVPGAGAVPGVGAAVSGFGVAGVGAAVRGAAGRRSTAAATAQPARRRAAGSQARGAARVPGAVAPAAIRYETPLPSTVATAFFAKAKGPLARAEQLHRDVAGRAGIRWQLLAACDWMQCHADHMHSPVNGERLGKVNPDGTVYQTKSQALAQCASDLIYLAGAVYGLDLTARHALPVRALADVFAAFRWGGLLKRNGVSAMEFPYSVAGLTEQHLKMHWPVIGEPDAPDKPGSKFRGPFGAVPVLLSLSYPALV